MKNKKPETTFNIIDTEDEHIKETQVFINGIYSHSVNCMIWPKDVIEELAQIHKKISG